MMDEKQRVRAAFEGDENPLLYDEVTDVYFKHEQWWVEYKNGAGLFLCPVSETDGGFEFIHSIRLDIPEYEPPDEPAFGGLLLPEQQTPDIATLMGEEVQRALGGVPTVESCERAGALLTAARDFLQAMRGNYVPEHQREAQNLVKLAQMFGTGDDAP
jgi:hypothetical protein